MIIGQFNGKARFGTQKVLFLTNIQDKQYFWMQDMDDTIYLLREVDGEPSFN